MITSWMLLLMVLAWWGCVGLVWWALARWLAEDIGPACEDEQGDDPHLVARCRELSELAARAKQEVRHD